MLIDDATSWNFLIPEGQSIFNCVCTRDVEAEAEAEAGSGGSDPFSVEAEARKSYRFRFYTGYLTRRVTWRKIFVHFPMWIYAVKLHYKSE